jgi:hypothetical protein
MQIEPGSIVRPLIYVAGLDPRQQYTVTHLIVTPFTSLAWLEDSNGALQAPVQNALLVLEVVRTATVKPAIALFN